MWLGFRLAGRRPLPTPTNRLQVTVLNVGHGEASWVRTAHGRFIVIGAGPPGQGARVAASLREAGAKRIDLLLLPYPYVEAIGGAAELISALPVALAVETGGPVVNEQQAQVRALLQSKKVRTHFVRAGSMFQLDGATVEILAPADPLLVTERASANNSLVVRLKWGATAFLWAGGIEKAGENALLSRAPDLSANWLRVARFAAPESSSPEFLRLVSPEFAVVSVGANDARLPDAGTMDRLKASGAQVLRTDSRPAPLVFYSDGAQVTGPF